MQVHAFTINKNTLSRIIIKTFCFNVLSYILIFKVEMNITNKLI